MIVRVGGELAIRDLKAVMTYFFHLVLAEVAHRETIAVWHTYVCILERKRLTRVKSGAIQGRSFLSQASDGLLFHKLKKDVLSGVPGRCCDTTGTVYVEMATSSLCLASIAVHLSDDTMHSLWRWGHEDLAHLGHLAELLRRRYILFSFALQVLHG